MQAVGNLHHQSADVILHRREKLLVVVNLFRHLVFLFLLLRHHIHEKRHVGAEPLFYVVDGVVGVLHNIVQERGGDGVGVEHQLLSRYQRHGDGVQDVRLAGFPALSLVRITCKLEGALQLRQLG